MKTKIEILIADDDSEDRMLIIDALQENNIKNKVQIVENGEELLHYLKNTGNYSNKEIYPLPGVILLDLNMPKMDGREALKEIKGDKNLCSIPLIIFTTSMNDKDVHHSYKFGANSFISKPVTFSSMVNVMESISKYWLETVELPTNIQ
ncbi:MAG: two-component system response regulator [Bacteroidetes bacterium RIFCSPLOWO2_12_FULL_35_15]|nr:MAG: two-component system response regulator [Bacteroidetes bacterium RIFCSPLOWO2_12_FULL_35_15]